MLKQPSDKRDRLQLYQAMASFKNTSDGVLIIKYLKSELQRLQNSNDNEDDQKNIRRIQGANMYGKKFLSMVETSNDEVRKLR